MYLYPPLARRSTEEHSYCQILKSYYMSNRTTLMERLNKQLSEMEAAIKKLGPIEGILERMNTLEDSIYTIEL